MTNPESHYPFIHWPVASTSSLTGIYIKNQDDYQIFHPPATPPTILTYFQAKDQAIAPYSTYVQSLCLSIFKLHHNKYKCRKLKTYFECIYTCLSPVTFTIE
jgi:hypothetical protein